MTDDKPRKIWLQVYDQEGNYMAPEDRTFSANERVNSTDICYVRWGKTDILSIERDAALARAEAAEAEAARLQYDLDRQLYRADALAARVAELEAQLASQQWRPVEEIPANTNVELRVVGGFRSDGYWYYHGPSKMRGWRPLPPTP